MKKKPLKHIAFILDGNKRWAKKNKIKILDGYKGGIENIYEIVTYIYNNNIEFLTLYLLSTENINRKNNISFFNLAKKSFNDFVNRIDQIGNIKINIIGEKDNLPNNIKKMISTLDSENKKKSKLTLNLAFNYGFDSELKSVIENVISYSAKNKININDVKIDDFFYIGNQPDPDILIRTGGYKRLSNFILKNLTYTEIYFLEILWPELKTNHIGKIIKDYGKIKRNYGL